MESLSIQSLNPFLGNQIDTGILLNQHPTSCYIQEYSHSCYCSLLSKLKIGLHSVPCKSDSLVHVVGLYNGKLDLGILRNLADSSAYKDNLSIFRL